MAGSNRIGIWFWRGQKSRADVRIAVQLLVFAAMSAGAFVPDAFAAITHHAEQYTGFTIATGVYTDWGMCGFVAAVLTALFLQVASVSKMISCHGKGE